MTLETLFCQQTVQPEIEKLVSDLEYIKDNPPHSHSDLGDVITRLNSHADILKSMWDDLKHITHIQKKTDLHQD